MIGGAILGYLDKNGTQIPTVPMLGRAGTLAVIAYFLRGKSPYISHAAAGFAAIAAYEFTREGSVSGRGRVSGAGVAMQT